MREIEAKFAVVNGVQPEELVASLDLPEGFQFEDKQWVDTLDVYLDTADLRLIRHGYALRIRRKEGRQLITLKSTGEGGDGIQDRLEIEESLGAASEVFGQRAWPKAIRRILASVGGDKVTWQPRCTLAQGREKHIIVLSSEGSDPASAHVQLAELSVDHVDVTVPSGSGEADDVDLPPAAHFAEVEIELLAEDRAQDFLALAAWLGGQETLAAIGGNKLLRGLRAIAGQPLDDMTSASGIQPDMYMADACRLIWRQQMIEMVLNEAGVRADEDEEFVHDMRVATRRARAAHVLLGDFFKAKQVKPHLTFFKRTAKRLGRVRDLDVALIKLHHYRRSLPKEQRSDLKPVAKYWKKQRKAPAQQLMEWLDSDAYALALIELDSFCTTPEAGAKRVEALPEGTPELNHVRHVLPSRILSRFEAVRRYEMVFGQENPPPLTTLHALRIDCKYLRYVLEFSQHLLGKDGKLLIGQLKSLQDVLGDLNDADVARTMLQDLPNSLQNDGVSTYVAQQDEIIQTLSERVPTVFADFVDLENRLLLHQAIARI